MLLPASPTLRGQKHGKILCQGLDSLRMSCCTTAADGMDHRVPTKVKGRRVLVGPVVHRASQGRENGLVFVNVLRVPPDQRTGGTYSCLYPSRHCHANLLSPEMVAGHLPERTDAACGGESRQRRQQQQGKPGPWYLQLQWPHANGARKPRRKRSKALATASGTTSGTRGKSSFSPQAQPCMPKTMGRLFLLGSVYMQAGEAAKA